MAKNDSQYGGWNYYTLQCGTIMTLISPGGWLHPAMRHAALESWQWIHQVAAPCSVIRGSGMTCHWISPVAAPCNVTHSSGIMTLNSPGGSTLQWSRWLRWHAMEFAQTSAILEFYIWFWFWPHHWSRHIILHQSAKFYQNRTTHRGKNDFMAIFKMADLSHLGFYGSNNGLFEKPMYNFL